MLTRLFLVVILQCTQILNHYIEYLKQTQCVNYTSTLKNGGFLYYETLYTSDYTLVKAIFICFLLSLRE